MCTVWAVVHTHSRTRIHVRNPDRVLAPLSCVCCLAGPWTASVCLSSNEPGVREHLMSLRWCLLHLRLSFFFFKLCMQKEDRRG